MPIKIVDHSKRNEKTFILITRGHKDGKTVFIRTSFYILNNGNCSIETKFVANITNDGEITEYDPKSVEYMKRTIIEVCSRNIYNFIRIRPAKSEKDAMDESKDY